ncbi:MAG TPA: EAL domain-containing protein [Burkholderiaceae bacterium]|jgi:predicted signal transduction protein with EAL and GGDEF domain|nr:EAL domain-containing protein [Burkholderiaceae bacterium]
MKPVEPAIIELAAAAAAAEADPSAADEGTVLLVDDDAIVRMLTAAGLAERGWRVIEADGGARALQLFEQERPQVVALDAVMPDLDGFATCERLRRLPGGAHVPVVMLTGLDDEQSIGRAYDAGATDFFVKTPGRWTLLSQRLRYLTRASRVREELARSRADLLKVQRIDVLTGLPNRRRFHEILTAELERAGACGLRTGLLLLGVNRFRHINDSLGISAGDQLLVEIARRLSTVARSDNRPASPCERVLDLHDDDAQLDQAAAGPRVARVGGDEFVLLLPDLHSESALEQLAGRALDAFQQAFPVDDQELFVTASIGAVVAPADGNEVDGLLSRADLAMRALEEQGGNGCMRYVERMNVVRHAHWKLESDLHRAIGLNQLRLVYQPKIDVATGMIVGAEALMRWQRDGEQISPSDFIPAAEDSGLIVPITEWALNEACRQINAWDRAGLRRIPVSVNISGRHLQRGNLSAPVKECLHTYRIPPGLLELEITETAMMRNLDIVLPQLQSLKAVGVALSIDDFGTGYSSLAYLKRLPIDTLKIDRSFVGELETSRESAALVAAIVAMGLGLRLDVVAEGVETPAQLQRLADHGCRLMQGFLFSRPVSPDQFAQLLAQSARSHWRASARQPALSGPLLAQGGGL